MSPRPGISTLITSAPIQANSWVAVGAAWTWPRSNMRTPSSALLIRLSVPIPAQAGTHTSTGSPPENWIPTFVGMPLLCRIEKIAVLLDMRGEPQRVLARQTLGQLGLAPLQRLDDPHMVGNRTRRAVVLMDRDLADRAHVDEQILGHVGKQCTAAHLDDRLLEGGVRL